MTAGDSHIDPHSQHRLSDQVLANTIETHGIAGLHVTRTQFYRGASRARPAYHSEATIQTGRLLVNLNTRVVSVEDQPVHLTGKQYRILELLSLGKGTTLTKEMFLDHLYGGM